MFKRILVPVDLTEKNRAAVDAASSLALEGGATVTLVHVVETIADAPFEELEDFYSRLERKAHERLREWVEELVSDGVDARQLTAFGRRSEEILRTAEEEGADLIVLSSHPVEPESGGRGWGTLSYKVALLARCPVLLVK